MRISVACNWKLDLLDLIEKDENIKENVHDFYGTHDMSFTGSGRPFFLMAKRNKTEMENFINKVHDLNKKFTWLWNGECLGYYKFNSKEQLKAVKQHGWAIEFIDDGKPKPLVSDVSVLLFQAVRELVNNVIKHARARNMKITASRVRSSICITVEDDGLGFDMEHVMSARKRSLKKEVSDYSLRGFGLFNIRERLDHIGGSIEIHSKSGRGTIVTLFAPLLKTRETRTKNRKKMK